VQVWIITKKWKQSSVGWFLERIQKPRAFSCLFFVCSFIYVFVSGSRSISQGL